MWRQTQRFGFREAAIVKNITLAPSAVDVSRTLRSRRHVTALLDLLLIYLLLRSNCSVQWCCLHQKEDDEDRDQM
ncbi:hypothetical protein L1987_12501 [Smallanthus sonchifolius]|uniref:Uncharacterized protein n=1 Tax=Smallanthus sonchifolius TaxID=185202 RepID=A0ACB9JG92_9ASTR|nr:hypothetical protein L1987_12501 [Smallanthus sonchifolius]